MLLLSNVESGCIKVLSLEKDGIVVCSRNVDESKQGQECPGQKCVTGVRVNKLTCFTDRISHFVYWFT